MTAKPSPSLSRAVPLLIGAGFVLRLWIAGRAAILEHDGAYYVGLAAAMLRGDLANGLSTVWPPLYPALVALVAWPMSAIGPLTPERLELAARLVSVAAGTLALELLHRWTRRVAGDRAALVALAVAAFHPRLVQYSASALTEMTFIVLVLAGLTLLAEADVARSEAAANPGERSLPGPAPRDLTAGAAFGLAAIARPEGAVLAAVVAAVRVWCGWRERSPSLPSAPPSRQRFRFAAPLRIAFALGALVALLPWAAFVSVRLGHVSLGEKGAYNFWRAFKSEYRVRFDDPPGLSERVFESPELAAAAPRADVHVIEFVRAEPALVIQHSLGRLARIVTQSIAQACYPAWFAFALLGAPLLARPALWPAAAILIVFPFLYAPFSDDRRFFVPVVPLLLALVPAGLDRIATWVAPPPRRPAIAVGLAILLALAGAGYTLLHPLMEEAPEHRAAGQWLRGAWPALTNSATPARPIVMSRKTWVPYYAGGLIAELPEGGLDSVTARIQRKRADVLVVDERWAVPNRPELEPLLDTRNAPWPVLHVIESPRKLVLYDVRHSR